MNPFSFEVCPKVNIFLKIVGYEQGYHLLVSRLILVKNSFKDYIHVKRARVLSIKGNFDCAMLNNTIFKALQALKFHLECKGGVQAALLQLLGGLEIEVEKNIPAQAGFGGGSADAGVFLRELNTHLNLGLSLEELYKIGSRVGSDVNFFISGLASAHVSHFGEVVKPFEDTPLELELLAPQIACETQAVYRAFSQTQPISFDLDTLKHTHSKTLLQTHSRFALNDLLQPALKIIHPLRELEERLAPHWFFSGSGSGFFAPKEGRA
ncbi:4-(cytidine 5'-diphospho)-2-C-methyl-D-erythritol kinase [Helicobacter baculiformis]|uniref:4-(cytidine 5'-diphospho)-2-C-methyl-D-erythritol kinase n=1 Tax=Helicobacter baculiformis TaxID=427351 RepID=A0ABV7ZGK3_9HELI|nr:4-(cytidine 5'-diphospho)-2-C-methyl-D-erythritol kinase [Helicobacter baculiformis]